MSDKAVRTEPGEEWLREENPELYYMLRGLAGDAGALGWLAHKSEGLWLFTRAVAGERKASAAVKAGRDLDLEDLFGTIDDPALSQWLHDTHAELYLLFQAIKGDDVALHRLQRKKAGLGRLVESIRPSYADHLRQDPAALLDGASGNGEIPGEAAADVSCLIGEMHLSKGEYARAVEAFTRSLETEPSADAYEGRARAYRELALADERRAHALART